MASVMAVTERTTRRCGCALNNGWHEKDVPRLIANWRFRAVARPVIHEQTTERVPELTMDHGAKVRVKLVQRHHEARSRLFGAHRDQVHLANVAKQR